jgi:hypothetical protein
MELNPNDILGAAQQALNRAKEAAINVPPSQEVVPSESCLERPVTPYTTSPQPRNESWDGAKFPDFPAQLRDTEGVNLHDVKKYHLAALVETLERTIQSHESYPTPDAAIAVSSISEQVQKLIKDLEKSQDPRLLCEAIVMEVLQPLVIKIVQAVAIEAKWLKQEARGMVLPDKMKAFDEVVHKATDRVGPSLNEGLEQARIRMIRLLQIKEK